MNTGLGMVFGAWLFIRGGWEAVWVAAGTVVLLTILDRAFGTEIGRHMAEWIRRLMS